LKHGCAAAGKLEPATGNAFPFPNCHTLFHFHVENAPFVGLANLSSLLFLFPLLYPVPNRDRVIGQSALLPPLDQGRTHTMEKRITGLDSAITAMTTKRPHRHRIAAPEQ